MTNTLHVPARGKDEPAAKQENVKFSIVLTPQLSARLDELAAKTGASRNSLIKLSVCRFLDCEEHRP